MAFAVLTRSYDNARSGANTQESGLHPDVVSHGLRKLFSLQLDPGDDPRLEAQPLIVPGVQIGDGKTHTVAYVCTMSNSVYAFDADTGAKLWPKPVNLGKPINGSKSNDVHGNNTIDSHRINKLWGILSTPVVDIEAQTLFVVSWSVRDGSATDTVDPRNGPNNTIHRLHALKLTDGSPRPGSPVEIAPTAKAKNGSTISFTSVRQKQRASLLLVPLRQATGLTDRKTVYVGCGQTQESLAGTHGWLVAFDADTLRPSGAVCTSPNGKGAGIWQAGQGPSADSKGNVYAMTGNGTWADGTDFAESFIKLTHVPPTSATPGGLIVADFFTPFRDQDRGQGVPANVRGVTFDDQDLGSAAPLVLDDKDIVLGAGKDGVLYVLNKANMGKAFRDFNNPVSKPDLTKLKSPPIFFTFFPGAGRDAGDESFLDTLVLREGLRQDKTHHLHASPLCWNSPDLGTMLFCWGENANLRAWTIDAAGKVTFQAMSHEEASAFSANPGGMPGGLLTLSADGANKHTGVVWATVPLKGLSSGQDNNGDANLHVVEGLLFAFDATDFGTNPGGSKFLKMLWNSHMIPGNTFHFSKFCPPVVADGKVYVTTYDGRVDVYGP